MLINVKMSKIVGIFTFMSRINFMLSRVEHEESFITIGPDLCDTYLLLGHLLLNEVRDILPHC